MCFFVSEYCDHEAVGGLDGVGHAAAIAPHVDLVDCGVLKVEGCSIAALLVYLVSDSKELGSCPPWHDLVGRHLYYCMF